MAKLISTLLLLVAAVISLQGSNAEIAPHGMVGGLEESPLTEGEELQVQQEAAPAPVPPTAGPKRMTNNMKMLITVASLALLAALGGAGYFGYTKFAKKEDGADGRPAAEGGPSNPKAE